jgi:hypothetical protein
MSVAFAYGRDGRRVALLSISLVALLAIEGPAHAEGQGTGWKAETKVAERGDTKTDAAQGTGWKTETKVAQKAAPPPAEKAEDKPVVSDKRAVAPNATVNLLNLLAEKGVITREQANELIPQVDNEDFVVREALKDAATKADDAAKAATAAASAAAPPGSRRVSYVPDSVKRELRDEVRNEVMTKAKNEGWASPGAYPEWASRIKFSGDIRGRFEGQFFPSGYNATGQLIDFNAINTGSPYDLSNANLYGPPLLNTTQDRERFRLRARLAMDADLSEGFTAGIRMATGSDSSPVSTNQTLGASGGNFSKYSLWLDRAYLKYDTRMADAAFGSFGPMRGTDAAVSLGRFDNPFWSPTDLVWHKDLGFDGLAIQTKRELRPGFTSFAAAGAFPIFNTALDFASDQAVKTASDDKYLLGAQLGFKWQMRPEFAWTLGASYFDFENVQGRLSSLCDVSTTKSCDTDSLRPSFAQKGNTYTALRNVYLDPAQTNPSNPQYFGLASAYRPIVAATRLDFGNFHPVHVLLDGEFVWNSAFEKSAFAHAVNNYAANTGLYNGGSMGWLARLTVGHQDLKAFGDWNAHIGYKYLESDATVDAFVDSDFGLGGTNLKGYFVGGNFALSKNVYATARWLSANAIAGAPYAVDVLQVDLNAKF